MKVSKMFMIVCLSLHTRQYGDLSIARCTLADSSWKILFQTLPLSAQTGHLAEIKKISMPLWLLK